MQGFCIITEDCGCHQSDVIFEAWTLNGILPS